VRHRVENSAARALIASAETHAWLLEDPLADQVQLILCGEGVPAGVARLEDLMRDASDARPALDTAIDDPAILIYTSGTTGLPKGALHGHRVVAAHAEPMSLAHNLFGRDGAVFWSPADWAWAGGLIDCLYSTWLAGRPIVAWRPRGFDPDAVLAMFAQCGVTNTFLPGTALKRLRDAADVQRRARALALRSVMTGGERTGADVIEWTTEVFGTIPNEVYGQTEVSMVLGNSSEWLPVVPGSLGMPYPRVRVAVLDDSGDSRPAGLQGELALHRDTPAMFLGYWDPAAQAPAYPGCAPGEPPPEWHRTGDLGHVDDNGYFWHDGRRDDVILSSGYRIGPAEVEDALSVHPAVATASVIGEPDELRGELVSAVVELRPGAEGTDELRAELQDLVRRRLAAYEVPRRVHFATAVPRTESGKVKRAELRRLVLAGEI
jgi:acetyl-CoA synthetase